MSIREDFEAWIDNPHKLNRRTEPGFTEEYEHPWTLGAWAAYQAATSLQEAKIKVLTDALEQIKHSITQMQMPGNDKRREVLLIQNIVALALAKETP